MEMPGTVNAPKERTMKNLCCALLAACVGGVSGWAADRDPKAPGARTPGPEELTRANWDAVISVLRNQKLDPKAKEMRIEQIASPLLDFPLMAKLALGRTYWHKFTSAQREKYVDLFVKRLKSSYRKRIATYKGEGVRFTIGEPNPPGKATPAKRRAKGTVYVPLQLVTQDKTVAILHKFRKRGKTWLIYDIEIEGVSILLTYRSQFRDILRRGTPEDLLSRLAQPARE